MTINKGLQLTRLGLRGQLQRARHQLLEGMEELIVRKNYSKADQILRLVENQLNELIEHLGGPIAH